jgi:hypothetical protein
MLRTSEPAVLKRFIDVKDVVGAILKDIHEDRPELQVCFCEIPMQGSDNLIGANTASA